MKLLKFLPTLWGGGPAAGWWRGIAPGATSAFAALPLHHALQARSPSPHCGEDLA